MLLIQQYNLAPNIPWFRENSFEFNGNIEELIPTSRNHYFNDHVLLIKFSIN